MFEKIKPPLEIVYDESKALLKAICRKFAKTTDLNDYVSQCMSALLEDKPTPSCYVWVDRSHFVKNFARKIKDRDFRRRQFFHGVVGYLIKCENFEVAKRIISDFFTVILNRFDGSIENKPLPSEESKIRLQDLIRIHNERADYDDDDDEIKLDDTDLEIDVDCNWITNIVGEVIVSPTAPDLQQHENLYFSPGEKKFYITLFSSIVLCSNVMNSLFESTASTATSSDIESSFKSLKRNITSGKMISVNLFLPAHIEYLNAEVKLNATSATNSKDKQKKRNRSNSLGESPATRNKGKRSNSLDENAVSAMRKRSSSNQFEYYESQADGGDEIEENGKISSLEFYILADILKLYKEKRRFENDCYLQRFSKIKKTIISSEIF